ncbi:MAG: hypothetical protein KDD25_04185, partial [Bdellovibrionales bacterium]|nr:hypothetical protein [Bdellovibrionales bacterium]
MSDLRQKLDLQYRLIQKNRIISSEAIIRVSELWKSVITSQFPHIQTVDSELIKTTIKSKLRMSNDEWSKYPGAASSIYSYLDILLPIVNHSEGVVQLSEWLKDNDEARERWGHWFLQSLKVWEDLLERNWLPANWFSAFLYSEDLQKIGDGKRLIFDLNGEIRSFEVDLIKKISKNQEVLIIVPNPNWLDRYPEMEKKYQIPRKVGVEPKSEDVNLKPVTKRFPTMLSEVKEAVNWVREKVVEGVPLAELAIVAPDISVYWPVLEKYLEVEGIPSSRTNSNPLGSYLPVARWLSRLQVELGNISCATLEATLFSDEEVVEFETFKKFYSTIAEESDLTRIRAV